MAPSDTTQSAQAKQIELHRAAGTARRAEIALGLSSSVIRSSRQALARQNPDLDEHEIRLLWAELHYGADIAEAVREYLRARA